ncbi:hypothetical protein [Streptomyces goshikiensis]|uniref:hypothetical protein n=1 Tax=Streptomyces goshikiensis TaxID=1942 RepID=UPI00369E60B8
MERRRAIIIAAVVVVIAAVIGAVIAITRSSHDPSTRAAVPPSTPDNGADSPSAAPADSVPQVIEPDELAAAHRVMRDYLITIGTYTSSTDSKAWTAKARELTDGSPSMAEQTTLPTGRTWAECVRTKCSSTATADLTRDTVISNAPVDGAGRSVTTLASTTVTLSQARSTTQTTEFAITASYADGTWKISSLQLSKVGDAGMPEAS